MDFLYAVSIKFYYAAIQVAALFNPKARQFIIGRKNWKSKLPKVRSTDEWIWFQASSQGEFEDGLSLMKTIRKNRPELKILLTFFSPSGYENKKNHQYADYTMYLPLDLKSNAAYLLGHFRFKSIFFVRHDIWKNYLEIAKQKQIPCYLIFCTITDSSSMLKGLSKVYFKKGLQCFNHIFCHDQTTIQLLKQHFDLTNTTLSGSTRVENIVNKEVYEDSLVEAFTNERKTVIIGSSNSDEEKMLIPFIEKMNNVRWIIVPHEVERDFSHIPNASLYSDQNINSNVLVLNTIGLLSSVYRYCNIAIVGGGFTKMGIHNIIEPAKFGIPVLFGPNDRNYPEAKALIEEGQAFKFKNAQELENLLTRLLDENKNYSSNYINHNKRVSSEILKELESNHSF